MRPALLHLLGRLVLTAALTVPAVALVDHVGAWVLVPLLLLGVALHVFAFVVGGPSAEDQSRTLPPSVMAPGRIGAITDPRKPRDESAEPVAYRTQWDHTWGAEP
jgi:hypothetical protein